MPLFSKRYHRALLIEKSLKVSIPARLRRRLSHVLREFNYSFHIRPDPYQSWTQDTDALTEVTTELLKTYGESELKGFDASDRRVVTDLLGFVEGGYPAQVLDVIECAYTHYDEERKARFQREVNAAFAEENCPWRLTDGAFFQVNSEFLALQVLARSHELLRAQGFEGALEEFIEARNDLAAGNPKGAIHNACKSFESTLKSVLEVHDGNASKLLASLKECDALADMPEPVRSAICGTVLMALPTLRNKLGGHGQGLAPLEVPRHYADLAINIAGAFNQFLVSIHLERSTPAASTSSLSSFEMPPIFDDDDLPF